MSVCARATGTRFNEGSISDRASTKSGKWGIWCETVLKCPLDDVNGEYIFFIGQFAHVETTELFPAAP
jgi:hypothetical protein